MGSEGEGGEGAPRAAKGRDTAAPAGTWAQQPPQSSVSSSP